MNGIVYEIKNKINGKFYIGKTKEFYGKSKFGINGRLNKHFLNALSDNEERRNECPRLYNAIRKYGKENFTIECLLKCEESEYDEKEIEYILNLDSTNRDIGYNIAKGGMGRSVVEVSEETRQKISNSNVSKNTSELNIRPYKNKKNDIVIGYVVRRRIKGQQCQKYFTSMERTLKENYKLAKDWLYALMQNNLTNDKKNNKPNNLPLNINPIKDKNKNKIIGYSVSIIRDKKLSYKSFQSKTIPNEELLKEAIKFKNSILENKVKIIETELK
jgi:group I intron endonuclease